MKRKGWEIVTSISAILACLLVINCGACAEVYSRGDVVFYTSFESKDADYSIGNTKGILRDGGGQLTADGFDSVRGRALCSGEGLGSIEYNFGDRNVVLDEGTIEIWVKPGNWGRGNIRGQHRFIEITCENGGTILFSLLSPQEVNNFRITGADFPGKKWDERTPRTAQTSYGTGMLEDMYVHYFLIWKKGEFIAYYRGYVKPPVDEGGTNFRYVHKSLHIPGNMPSSGRIRTIRIGDFGGQKGQKAFSYIDEVYVYKRALTFEECVWCNKDHSLRQKGMDIPSDFMQPALRLLPDPRNKVIEVNVDSGNLHAKVHGTVRMEPAMGTQTAPIKPLGKRYGLAHIAYTDLPPGEYRVIAELTDENGKALESTETELIVPAGIPEWLGNTIGISEVPPPPWTALKADKDFVDVWGRKYALGELGLPKAIDVSVRSKSLLAGPVELVLPDQGGKALPWEEKSRDIKTTGTVEADVSGVSKAGSAQLSWRCHAEFDGMLRYDFSMPAGTIGQGLQLRIPLKTSLTTLWYHNRHMRGELPKGEGDIWKADFLYYLWLGNEELGLCVFQEDNRGWIQLSDKGIRLERKGDRITLVYDLASKPFRLAKPWMFTFGLQATPVKPMPKDRRTWRSNTEVYDNICDIWPNSSTDIYFPQPSPKDPEAYKNKIAGLQSKGLKVCPYSGLTFTAPYLPEYVWFKKDWGRYANSNEGKTFPAHTFVSAVPTWVDFIVWKNVSLMDAYGYDGIYVDFAGARFPAYAPDLGLGYDRDGQAIQGLPIFRTREIYKRVYTAFKQRGADKLVYGHTSDAVHVPVLAFCDIWMDGEGNWKGQLKGNYLDVLPLDELRAEFMGHQYGAVHWLLPQWYHAHLDKKDVEKWQANGQPAFVSEEKCHHLFGLGLLHDFNLRPICGNGNRKAMHPFYKALDEFGYSDAEFYGYWNNNNLIGGQSEAIKVSVYRKPKGQSLFCIYNTTRRPVQATLQTDWTKWTKEGSDRVELFDVYTRQQLQVGDNCVTVKVPPLNYRLLWAR